MATWTRGRDCCQSRSPGSQPRALRRPAALAAAAGRTARAAGRHHCAGLFPRRRRQPGRTGARDYRTPARHLAGLHPWRKGPFELFGVHIDTEWRSDWKWDRLVHAIDDLAGHRVLDVGCGSGYHCWRMLGAGAAEVIGIDPTPLFVVQYWALQKYLQRDEVWVLPAGIEQLPPKLRAFDTVFSMGVLYHRRSPWITCWSCATACAPAASWYWKRW